MPKKGARFQKLLQMFIFLIGVAAILFGIFAFIAAKSSINVLGDGLDAIRKIAAGTAIGSVLESMQANLSSLYMIVIAELVVLVCGVVISLFAIRYLINLYYVASKASLVDELTNIYNRRATYKILDQEIKRARRFNHPLSILMIDIDFFKIYNDKNGHIAGDSLLKKISRLVESKVRDIDSVGRYGGEEFIVILPETPHEDAAKVSERIRKAVESTYFEGQEAQPKGMVTVSMGLVTFRGEYKGKTHLIHSADELLYKAKESGRNQLMKAYYKIEPKKIRGSKEVEVK